jgi:hypothetical protein
VLVSKYTDHLPLFRQAQIYARQGIALDDWVGRAAWHFRPVHERLLERIRLSTKIFADETKASVLDPGRGRANGNFAPKKPSNVRMSANNIIIFDGSILGLTLMQRWSARAFESSSSSSEFTRKVRMANAQINWLRRAILSTTMDIPKHLGFD